jgi:hypothetical protein
MRTLILSIVFFTSISFSFSQLNYTESEIQKTALLVKNIPKAAQRNTASLVSEINKIGKTERIKTLAIYEWITHNISYDTKALVKNNLQQLSADEVIKSQAAVCSGYAAVFKALATGLGLECELIEGYAKGYGYEQGTIIEETNHVWNKVKIDGQWYLIDATWGAGSVREASGKLIFISAPNLDWFILDPLVSIYSHFPVENKNQLIEVPLTKVLFDKLPNLDPIYFSSGFLNSVEIMAVFKKSTTYSPPKLYNLNIPLKITEAPKTNKLSKKDSLHFEIQSSEIKKLYLMIDDVVLGEFKKNGELFTYLGAPYKSGVLEIIADLPAEERLVLLEYNP